MGAAKTNFDVQSFADDHWTSVEQHPNEDSAKAAAQRLFAASICMGVRIVQETVLDDGAVDGEVIYSEIRDITEANLEIVAIDDAHMCADIYDFYGIESRMTISRLLRRYIDRVYLTPTEFLHNYRALQNIKAYGNLLKAGAERVASLQGKMPGHQVSTRLDKIYDVVTKITQRVHKVGESGGLPAMVGHKFVDQMDAAIASAPAGREDFPALVLLCRDLVQHRSWLAKFERLAKLAGPDPREDVLALIDGVVADLLYLPSAFDDIVGFQRNMGHLLCTIADLCNGEFNAQKSEAKEQLALFMPLLAAGKMPQTHAVLLDRLTRQITSSQPLDRYDPARERDTFKAVATRLRKGGEVLGGTLVADALSKREISMFGPGGIATAAKAAAPAAKPDPRRMAAQLAEMVAQGAEVRTFPPGSLIFREGDAPDHGYMIVSGQVEIITMHRKQLVLLARLGEDAFFGELALFSPMKRTATATTLEGCQLRVIDMREMQKRIESLDPFCQYWLQYLVGRITDLSARVTKSNKGAAA
ncbi:hypothetical protein CU669_05435 [Paramagnetospirillum kuznetsovii]|uniref:Cyclic nucleotide-binding domain-containing protein n=1 Tax=Paramagnetospirillum kuznetsovii TaxID=2053833 RepID=A0A364P0G9_9PROT|nr:cyclic nucleotide-binding domain-containing protein [Paramagnetospirillum kuznetsovii]RAU22831.1 hypothetical protein CU669_05435 [Paramagnetospirillum kuznetsovii]